MITAPRRLLTRRSVLLLAPIAVLLTGCTATGGGTIHSNDLVSTATFGLNADVEVDPMTGDITQATFSGTYHDANGKIALRNVDVSFKGTGVMKPKPGLRTPGSICLNGVFTYTSQNPMVAGSGTVDMTLCDNNGVLDPGGALLDDDVTINVLTGPYSGYANASPVIGGNITTK